MTRDTENKSCVGCKYMYTTGAGYSNYTWLANVVDCALDRNPHFLTEAPEEPSDWNNDANADNWPKTNTSRCELYAEGEFVRLDVDGEDGPADYTDDEEAIAAICKHSGRLPHGYSE